MILALVNEALLVWLFAAGLWVSFRVLRYPDLAIEQVAVLMATVLVATTGAMASGLVGVVAVVLCAAIVLLRDVLHLNGVLVALCLGYASYSTSLLVLGGPNGSIDGHTTPSDWVTFGVRGVFVLGCVGLLAAALHSRLGLLLIASGSNRELFLRLRGKNALVAVQGLGHLLAMVPLGLFAFAMVHRSGFVDVGIVYGRLLQALFVVLGAMSFYSRCRFELAAPVMLVPAVMVILLGRLVIEVGLPSSLYSGLMAVGLLVFLLTVRSSSRKVFRVEEVLRA